MPCQCRWLGSKVKPNSSPAIKRFEHLFGAVQVEGDLARMHLEGESDAALPADVQDRLPFLGEIVRSPSR